MANGVRMTLRLMPEGRENLEWLANERGGVSYNEVIRRALASERCLVQFIRDGATVLIEDPDGRTREVKLV